MTYKFEQECVLSEGANAAGKAQDEHDPSDDDEEPHGVEASQVRDGWQVGQDALGERIRRGREKQWVIFQLQTFKLTAFYERHQSATAALQVVINIKLLISLLWLHYMANIHSVLLLLLFAYWKFYENTQV